MVDAEEWRERNFRDFAELEWSFPSLQNAYPVASRFFCCFFPRKLKFPEQHFLSVALYFYERCPSALGHNLRLP